MPLDSLLPRSALRRDDEEPLPLKYTTYGQKIGPGWRKLERVPFGTRLRPDVILMMRAQTRHSGEHINAFLTRLIKAEFERNPVSMD